ncbi:MAG: IclR family transcriptional regulator [Halosimplex sp.]
MNSGSGRRIKSAENSFRVVDFLHERQRATLGEIADHLDLSKSTTHSYLETLVHLELVRKVDDEYELGLKFLDYGGRARTRSDLFMAAKPQLRTLHSETEQTVHLAVEEYEDLVLLERINPDESVGFGAHAGHRDHFHTPALGKAILAYLPEEKVDSILSKHGMSGMTDRSITSREELEDELERIREQGFAVNDEEEHRNYKGIARPLLVEEEIRGAISVAGPKTEIEMNEDEIHDLLRSAADRIEIKLQYD